MTLINNRIFAVHEIKVGDLLGWDGNWLLVLSLDRPESFSGERIVTTYSLASGKITSYLGGYHGHPWQLHKL